MQAVKKDAMKVSSLATMTIPLLLLLRHPQRETAASDYLPNMSAIQSWMLLL
jgi:hypothetical protein